MSLPERGGTVGAVSSVLFPTVAHPAFAGVTVGFTAVVAGSTGETALASRGATS